MDLELSEYLLGHYKQEVSHALHQLIQVSFPNIKNLNVDLDDDNKLIITFDDGEYTKEDVEKRIDEIRNQEPMVHSADNYKVIKSEFIIKFK